jgi:DNA (cytosine-5)-methyltransferase 1|tara:strand:- start:2012 stop:3358 length:1347 start_codon:yes stop_codon:yes gene_type:complete
LKKISVGSVCSGIEAASVALTESNFKMAWFSEIAAFPSQVLKKKYPDIKNLGDMANVASAILSKDIIAPDLICGGTPCQAFSLAGWKKGLEDKRGNLTLSFINIIEQNDKIRLKSGLTETIMLWENVEGVLTDTTNAFGCFLSSLLGADDVLTVSKWPSAGIIHGSKRNVAWRVLDAKYFGLPQQRKRVYVLAGGVDFYPENVLFDQFPSENISYNQTNLQFEKNGHQIEVFRSYSDCLYSAFGTKWNGNAAANNGSLFVAQNNRLRRMTPLECERLMGFPDHYTSIEKASPTNRYQALGNSWAVPVIKWIGERLHQTIFAKPVSIAKEGSLIETIIGKTRDSLTYYKIPTSRDENQLALFPSLLINGSKCPQHPILGDIFEIIDTEPEEKFYISPVGCKGILRRKDERNSKINKRLDLHLTQVASTMDDEAIEKRSRVQKRGRFSSN